MYTALGSKQFAKAILWTFGAVIGLVFFLADGARSPLPALKLLGSVTGGFALVLFLLLGMSWYWCPWRIIWRWFPVLNERLYPDLNGVWYGTTRSNWSVISKLREAADRGAKIDLAELDNVDLQAGAIAMQVKSSFFGISIRSKTEATGGDSTTITARADSFPDDHKLELSYLYRQATPEPRSTDEESHVGAAVLEVKPGDTPIMEGHYWTRRKWREGSNTAGLIRVEQVSARHVPASVDLLEFAKASAGR